MSSCSLSAADSSATSRPSRPRKRPSAAKPRRNDAAALPRYRRRVNAASSNAASSGIAASRVRSDGYLEARQRLGKIDLARQSRRGIAEVGQFPQQFHLLPFPFRQPSPPPPL